LVEPYTQIYTAVVAQVCLTADLMSLCASS